MKAIILAGLLTCAALFGAERIPEPGDALSVVAVAPAAKAQPDVAAVLAEIVKRLPAPPVLQTQADKDTWTETLQTLVKELTALIGTFLVGWKWLHDHHDRIDERGAPTPTADEQKVLDKFKAGGVISLLLVCCFLFTGCGGGECHERRQCAAVEANCPGETHQCFIDKDGRKVCK